MAKAAVAPRRYNRLAPWLIAATALLGGCETLHSMDQQEMTWQAMHAIDVAQTLNAASDPCYKEKAWLTSRLIGAQPSDAEVLAWGVATAVVHAWVSHTLRESDAPRWVQKVWDFGTLGHTTYAISNNHEAGVRPFGSNKAVPGCYAG